MPWNYDILEKAAITFREQEGGKCVIDFRNNNLIDTCKL